jgi:hypothetical protein
VARIDPEIIHGGFVVSCCWSSGEKKVVLGKCQAVVSKLIISIKRSRWLVYVVGSSEWMVAIAKCQLAMITGLIRTN